MIERYALASLTSRINSAATSTHVSPSDGQKEAGNYRKGRFWLHGKEFVIETPQGEIRRGKDGRGTPWESPPMPSHYGYIRRTLSEADGDHLDVFVGSRPKSPVVWVIDQHKPDGSFDEHKAMVGFSSEDAAKQAYRDSFHKSWRGLGHITALTVPQFLRWMDKGDTGKPIHRQERQWYSMGAIDEPDRHSRLVSDFNRAMVERYAAQGRLFGGSDTGGTQKRMVFDEDKHPRETAATATGDKKPGEFAKKDSPVAAAKTETPAAQDPASRVTSAKPKWFAKGNDVHETETGARRGAFRDPATATNVAALWNERDMPKAAVPSAATPVATTPDNGAQFLTGEAKDKHLANLAAKARAKGYVDVSITDVTPAGYGPTSEPEQKPTERPTEKRSLLPSPDVELDNPREHPVTTAINKRIMEDFGEKIGGARKDTAVKTGPLAKKTDTTKDERPAWARRYNVSQIASSSRTWEVGKWAIHDSKDTSHWGQPRQKGELFDSKEAAEAAIPLIAVARNHRVSPMQRKAGDPESYGIVRDITDRKRALVKGGFGSRDEAMKYMATHPVEIIEHEFPRYEDYAYLDHVERQGPEHKKGDVTPEDFQKAFQFRGGEFGNWNSGKDGQTSLNHGYDALHDLADALGLPPKAVALNGDLAIAFGARGTGGLNSARAHYEPDKRVMNLTKMKGAGSLAHEWGHALDHAISQTGGVDNLAIASESNWKLKLRPEVESAAKKLRNAMYSTEKTVVAQAADKDRQVKQRDLAKEAIASQFSDLEKGMVTTPYRKVKPFTPEQQKRWDAAKEKILSGDAGEASYHYNSSDGTKPANARGAMAGKWSYTPLEEMNKLYKQATGRSFHTADSNSTGNSIYWAIKRHAEANKRVAESDSGDPKTVRGKSDFLNESVKLDNTRTSNYYSEPHEMFARAFESYVDDKLKEKGQRSDYLVGSGKTDNRHYAMLDMKPFPEGEERKRINSAFDEFFQTLKQEHRKDDKGEHVRLYSRSRMAEKFQRAFVDRYELAPHIFKSIAHQIHGHSGFSGSGLMPLGGRLHGLPGWSGKSTGSGVGSVEFDPSKHPRAPEGTATGGKFVSKGGGTTATPATQPSTPSPDSSPRWHNLDPKMIELARRKILGHSPTAKPQPKPPLEPIGKLGPPPVFKKTPKWNPEPQTNRLGPAPELPENLKPKVLERQPKSERTAKPKPLGKRELAVHDVAKAAAEKHGVNHHDVLSMMRDVHQQRLDEHARTESIRKQWMSAHPNWNAGRIRRHEGDHDYDSIPGYDQFVEGQLSHGGFGGQGGTYRELTSSDPHGELWGIIHAGAKPKPKLTDEDIAEEAAQYVADNQPQYNTPHHRMRRSLDAAFETALQPVGAEVSGQHSEPSEQEYDDPSKGYFSRSRSPSVIQPNTSVSV